MSSQTLLTPGSKRRFPWLIASLSWCVVFAMHCLTASAQEAREIGEEERALLTKFVEEMVEVTPGTEPYPATLAYGQLADKPGEEVTLSHSFKVSTVEVTQELWEVVMGENQSRWKGARNSVEMLTFDEAIDFCEKLTERLKAAELLKDNQLVRLPTEVEWEYTSRAGAMGDYTFGSDLEQLDAYAWHTGNAAGNDPPVAAKKANAWGLFDVHGYLWEWCLPTNGEVDVTGIGQANWKEQFQDAAPVVRGGSWKDAADDLRLGVRRALARGTRDDAVGLRCVIVSAH